MADRVTAVVEEPAEDGALVLVGYEPDRWVYERVDDLDPAEPYRWYVIAGDRTDPKLWSEIARDKHTGERLPVEVLRRSAVTRAR